MVYFVQGLIRDIEKIVQYFLMANSRYYTKYGLSKKSDREFSDAGRYACKGKLNIWGDIELTDKYLRQKSRWGQRISEIEPSTADVQTKEWRYVASEKSEVFHRPDCKWVKKINADNLMGFMSREDAVKIGRRPCRSCKP